MFPRPPSQQQDSLLLSGSLESAPWVGLLHSHRGARRAGPDGDPGWEVGWWAHGIKRSLWGCYSPSLLCLLHCKEHLTRGHLSSLRRIVQTRQPRPSTVPEFAQGHTARGKAPHLLYLKPVLCPAGNADHPLSTYDVPRTASPSPCKMGPIMAIFTQGN